MPQNKFHCKRCDETFHIGLPKGIAEGKLTQCGCGILHFKGGNGKMYLKKHPHDMGGAEVGGLVREGRCEVCGIPLFGDGRKLGRYKCSEHKT